MFSSLFNKKISPKDESEDRTTTTSGSSNSLPTVERTNEDSNKLLEESAIEGLKDENHLIPMRTSRFAKIKGKLTSSLNNPFVSLVDDRTTLGTIWFVLVYLIFAYNTLTVSWRICFYHWFTDPLYWIIPDQITDAILYIDIIIRFFRPFPEKQTMIFITHPRQTAKKYALSLKLWIDIIGRFPLEWICFIIGYSSLLRLNRILLIYNSIQELKRFEHTRKKIKPNLRQLLQFLYITLIISHFVTCLWYLVVRCEYPNSRAWTNSNIIYDAEASWFYKYGTGLYWGFVVMAGYGGSMPVTDLEVGFQLFVTLLGMALFVSVIGIVGSLVTDLDVTASVFRQRMDTINDYMKYRSMSSDLRARVTQYYDYLWKTRKGLDETKILEDMPEFLRADVSMYLNRDIISKVLIFKGASPNFLSEIVMNLKPRISLPGSYIIRIGEPGREVFFINKGQVKVKLENGFCVATLGEGDFFGEMALITDGIRNANIIAQTFCDLFVLDKQDFDDILAEYPEEADQFYRVGRRRDQDNQSRAYSRTNTSMSLRSARSRSARSDRSEISEGGDSDVEDYESDLESSRSDFSLKD